MRDRGGYARDIRHAGARGAAAAGSWLSAVGERLAVPEPAVPDAPAGGSRYEGRWQPTSELEARQLILNIGDEERFEAGGREELDRLRPFISPGSTVLDLGCGIGRIARYVAPHCGTFWAVDVSPAMLDLARTRLADQGNVRYALCADTRVPDVPDGSVDFLYSILVLQHLEREDAFLLVEDTVRMLREGARALFTWPNLEDPGYLEAFVTYARNGEATNPSRARMYTRGELECLLPAAGFSKVEVLDDPNIVTICTR